MAIGLPPLLKIFEDIYDAISKLAIPSDETPLVASGSGSAGTNTEYSRSDHVHPAQTSVQTSTNATNATNATKVNQNVSTANSTYPILASATANATTNQVVGTIFRSTIKINPYYGYLYATKFVGDLTGNVTGNCSGSSSSCTGNAATATFARNATNAVNATNDGLGRNIANTYLPASGGTLTGNLFGNSVSITTSINVASGSVFYRTVNGNTTFTITGVPAGKAGCFTLVLTNAGNYILTWPASVKWANNIMPTFAVSGTDVLTFITNNGGTTWYAELVVNGVV